MDGMDGMDTGQDSKEFFCFRRFLIFFVSMKGHNGFWIFVANVTANPSVQKLISQNRYPIFSKSLPCTTEIATGELALLSGIYIMLFKYSCSL
jgi:hypothetical protein